ncbi:hypothetical protein AA103196_2741 [Ameyamaea chiangmaiensis NBRC 103196]|nr:hypothetical protein AA103196_2741 [Ameyamaea chiangmaiensis NBRC 103196]
MAWLLGMMAFAATVPRHAHAASSVGVSWWDAVTVGAQIEGGISANPARPANGVNFGALFGDRANQPQLDQITVTVARPIDETRAAYQVGFLLRGLYGADGRYFNIAGVSDHALTGRYQVVPVQAHIDLHLPWLSAHGLDVQTGILAAPMGIETLDPATRPFYTLAYTTEFSTPFEHVGTMAQWHLDDGLDVLFGVDTGNQVSFGGGDNNRAAAGYFGLGAPSLAGGRLAVVYLGRVGPEDAVRALGSSANHAQRFWNDLNLTWHATDRLILTGEFNVLHDEGLRADTVSVVSFASYSLTPTLSLNYRGEIFRDSTGLIVTGFLSDDAYMRAVRGLPADTQNAPATTYGALTLGVDWHPAVRHGVQHFRLRPEIRFDRSLNGTRPFNDLRDTGMFTFGLDAIVGF